MNDDKQRLGQPPIHTHLPDTIPPEDVKKIVGEPVPHGADYNSPPPPGAAKSMGSGLDESVGGPGLGRDPAERGYAASARDQDSRADDQHMGNLQQRAQPAAMQSDNLSGPQGGQGGNRQSGQQGSQQSGQQGGQQPGQQGGQQSGQQGGQQSGQQGGQQSGQQGGQQSGQQGGQQSSQQGGGSGQQAAPGNAQRDARSEGLLPGQGETDGRYQVSEEVSLDQQSDSARRVGSMEEAAKGPHGDKLADAVARSLGKDGGKP